MEKQALTTWYKDKMARVKELGGKSRTINQDVIQDVLGEVVLRQLERPADLSGIEDVKAYYNACMRNTTANAVKHENVVGKYITFDYSMSASETWASEQGVSLADGITRDCWSDYKWMIAHIMHKIERKERPIFSLYFIKGYTFAQIGEKIGVSKVAIHKRVKKIGGKIGNMHLRSLVDDRYIVPGGSFPSNWHDYTPKDAERIVSQLKTRYGKNMAKLTNYVYRTSTMDDIGSELEAKQYIREKTRLQRIRKADPRIVQYAESASLPIGKTEASLNGELGRAAVLDRKYRKLVNGILAKVSFFGSSCFPVVSLIVACLNWKYRLKMITGTRVKTERRRIKKEHESDRPIGSVSAFIAGSFTWNREYRAETLVSENDSRYETYSYHGSETRKRLDRIESLLNQIGKLKGSIGYLAKKLKTANDDDVKKLKASIAIKKRMLNTLKAELSEYGIAHS